jgi:hypothetical protein
MISADSPNARPAPVSNKFQQPWPLASRSCSGYSTRKRSRIATRFMRVLAAKLSASCPQPCSNTISGSRSSNPTSGEAFRLAFTVFKLRAMARPLETVASRVMATRLRSKLLAQPDSRVRFFIKDIPWAGRR